MKNDTIELSIIIPVYNSQKIIGDSLSLIGEWIKKQKITVELIAVDDGSTDQTKRIMDELKSKINNYEVISFETNKGKGYAVKKGLEMARGNYMLFTDTDLPYGLDIIMKMHENIKNHPEIDLLYGSRHHDESDYDGYDSIRKIGSLFFSACIRSLILPDVFDTQCGVKIMSKKFSAIALKKMTVDRFAFDIELFVIARANHLKYSEFPVILKNNSESSIKIFRDTVKMLSDILKIRKNYKKRIYEMR